MRLKTALLTAVLALGLTASNASAASITYDFTVANGFGGAGSSPYGRVTLTDNGANNVLVQVDLFNNLRFVSAFALTFGFNLAGITTIDITGPAGWTVDETAVGGPTQIDGMGSYEFGLSAPGSGGSNPLSGPLQFNVFATGLTLASFNEKSTGNFSSYFVADVIGSGSGASTGAIGVPGEGVPCTTQICQPPPCTEANCLVTPEPGTMLMLGTGLALLAARLRRRKA